MNRAAKCGEWWSGCKGQHGPAILSKTALLHFYDAGELTASSFISPINVTELNSSLSISSCEYVWSSDFYRQHR